MVLSNEQKLLRATNIFQALLSLKNAPNQQLPAPGFNELIKDIKNTKYLKQALIENKIIAVNNTGRGRWITTYISPVNPTIEMGKRAVEEVCRRMSEMNLKTKNKRMKNLKIGTVIKQTPIPGHSVKVIVDHECKKQIIDKMGAQDKFLTDLKAMKLAYESANDCKVDIDVKFYYTKEVSL